jgi:DNA-binding MarR family transcriptional regulator
MFSKTSRPIQAQLKPAPNEGNEGDSIKVIAGQYHSEYEWADPLSVQLCLGTDAASNAHHASAFRMYQALGFERTPGRYSVLRVLYFSPTRCLTQVEIGDDIRVTSANVTHLVDGLEKDGLVRRIPHPTDRRMTSVELLPAGTEVCEALIPSMARLMNGICEGFSDEEKVAFLGFLERFRQNANNLYAQDQP